RGEHHLHKMFYTLQAGPQILIARTPQERIPRQQPETLGNVLYHARGDINAAAFSRYVKPNFINLGFRLGRKAKLAHERGCCSAAKRAMPRRLTSSASCFVSSGVVTLRPSPRARDVSALSTAIRISSLRRSR